MPTLAERIGNHRWYHTIRLPDGTSTRGWYDSVAALEHIPLPESLAGKRCLDIGTADGFWAFEMERRSAAEVVALDIAGPLALDWAHRGDRDELARNFGVNTARFELAAEALDSKVDRRICSIYDVDREQLGGFDFVHIGALLLHLRDPVGALMGVRELVDGELLSVDYVSLPASLGGRRLPMVRQARSEVPQWWLPGLNAYRNYFTDAGYELLEAGRPFRYRFGRGFPTPSLRRPRQAAFRFLYKPFGATFAWVRARPRA